MIHSWSHSRAGDFQKCKFLAWLKYDQKIPEPPRPLPEGKTEHANDRGTRIHTSCEEFIIGKSKTLCIEACRHFEAQITLLRILFAEKKVSVEGEWAMNRDWETVPWNGRWIEAPGATPQRTLTKLPEYGTVLDVIKVGKTVYTWEPSWLRLKLDAIVFHSDTHATVIDFKSGKKFGNEIKHGEQLQLYQLVSFLRYPKLERVDAELWYLDQNEVTKVSFTRAQGLKFKANFTRIGNEITSCTDFKPNANRFSCKWCGYGPWEGGTGHCKVGVKL